MLQDLQHRKKNCLKMKKTGVIKEVFHIELINIKTKMVNYTNMKFGINNFVYERNIELYDVNQKTIQV